MAPILVAVAVEKLESSSDRDISARGAYLDSFSSTVERVTEVVGIGIRLCDVLAIDLKLTGCGRNVEFEFGSWGQIKAHISRGRAQLPIVVGYRSDVKISSIRRTH